ncbi:Hypothetical_protein [Hexamita inflata]|uniref:Hypothetical_protein n=1 Tax=Hexamita inflata TaxID=28002 RepID=A0AA86TGP4_9EUKA|nr:Hypothetical protein HINF_LOCUS5699 [Hexamita inflata]CAI9923063.1 Hypothetical protein HINF_LOCUS10708 [Hexamita inflata]
MLHKKKQILKLQPLQCTNLKSPKNKSFQSPRLTNCLSQVQSVSQQSVQFPSPSLPAPITIFEDPDQYLDYSILNLELKELNKTIGFNQIQDIIEMIQGKIGSINCIQTRVEDLLIQANQHQQQINLLIGHQVQIISRSQEMSM